MQDAKNQAKYIELTCNGPQPVDDPLERQQLRLLRLMQLGGRSSNSLSRQPVSPISLMIEQDQTLDKSEDPTARTHATRHKPTESRHPANLLSEPKSRQVLKPSNCVEPSTCDSSASSGFGSSSSGAESQSSTMNGSQASQCHSRSDTTDRLRRAEASSDSSGDSKSATPTSQHSGKCFEPNYSMHNDLQYSTLCRDEFSSFIEGSGDTNPSDLSQPDRPSERLDYGPEAWRSSRLPDRALDDERRYMGPSDEFGEPKLDALDIYIKRVECLLRLSRGDRGISMEDALGTSAKSIQLNKTQPTQLEFTPVKSKEEHGLKVIQEFTTSALDSDDEKAESEGELQSQVVSDNFRSILWAPQSSPELNWSMSAESEQSDTVSLRFTRNQLREFILDKFESLLGAKASLVSVVDEQLGQFLDTYSDYQRALRSSVQLANDWRQNWLFDYGAKSSSGQEQEVNVDSLCNKRQKMDNTRIELLSYPTLVLSKRAPVLLTYLTTEPCETIDRLYASDYLDDCSKMTSNSKLDVCNLLLMDDFECEDYEDAWAAGRPDGKRKRKTRRKRLTVDYESSCSGANDPTRGFSAYGYSFQFGRMAGLRADRLRERVLSKFGHLFSRVRPKSLGPEFDDDNVRFVVELANVELVNCLPVIQFCAKFSGCLPIKVSWFRVIEDGSNRDREIDISDILRPQLDQTRNIKIRQMQSGPTSESEQSGWPIGLRASYDYEYQTEWSSWFRFRRFHNEILFEIRNPNEEFDFDRTYKCVIENYCSRQERTFKLTRSPDLVEAPTGSLVSRLNKVKRRPVGEPSSKAILRTWSQRTLNRPTCSTTSVNFDGLVEATDTSDRVESSRSDLPNVDSCGSMSRKTLTRSHTEAAKIDKTFPYHPENLLRRLQENKYSIRHQTISGANPIQRPNLEPADRLSDEPSFGLLELKTPSERACDQSGDVGVARFEQTHGEQLITRVSPRLLW